MINTVDDSVIDPLPTPGTYAVPESAFVPRENPLDAVRQTIRSGYRDDDYTRLMQAYVGSGHRGDEYTRWRAYVDGAAGRSLDDLRRGG